MRAVFMGTPDFALGTLKKMIEAGHELVGVVTQPDKPKGRGKAVAMTPVKELALQHGIPVYQPVKVRDPQFVEQLKELEPEVIVVVAFGQLISKEILELPKFGCINVHASLLPAYRGAAPINWAVIDGMKESGVTIMRMDEGLDTGDMIRKVTVPLVENETGGSLFEKLSAAGAELLIKVLEDLENGNVSYEPQGETTTAYAKMLKKSMGQIDWNKTAAEIERLIRGLNPWPSAYTKFRNKTLKIWEAQVVADEFGKTPGEICHVDKKELYVKCGQGALALKEVQLEGKKRMQTEAFMRGNPVEKGEHLGE